MSFRHSFNFCRRVLIILLTLAGCQMQLDAASNVVIRVMAANLTSGNNQRYESPGLNIFKGLKPDVVALQEFNVSNQFGINTAAALREMVDSTFGTNFVYFRESGAGYSIPNGIISRYPFVTNGSWVDSDPGVNDRGFAWARIDLPGTNDLFVISVHLKASSGS
jgi:endonuclease/exonuclease/phosphatase family metal-dependent hydrolase